MKKNNLVGYITVVLLLATTSALSLNLYFQQRNAYDKLDINLFPYQVGEWSGKDLPITEKEYEILETRNLILREYTNASGESLTLFIIYSETNRAVFHPPEVCLIGSGTKIIDKRSEKIAFGKYNFLVNKLYTKRGVYEGLSLYCYKAGRVYTDNYYLQQAYFSLNQLFRKHQGGATIRASMPLADSEEKTLEKLKNFFAESVRLINAL